MSPVIAYIPLLLTLVQPIWSRAVSHSRKQDVRRDAPTNTACAVASAAWEAVSSATPQPPEIHIPAQIAYDCLQSVPNKPEPALELLNTISAWLEFQSDISYIADPVEGRLFPAYDIFAELETIAQNVQQDLYASEHDFQLAIWKLARNVHDAHLLLTADLLSVFTFARSDHRLVAASADGLDVPRVYVKADLVEFDVNSSTWKPHTRGIMSPVQTINGVPVVEALLNATATGLHQDPDANWNQLLANLGTATPFYNTLTTYPGPTTELSFANGTTRTYNNTAKVSKSFANITIETAEDMYQNFCLPPDPASVAAPAPTSDESKSQPVLPIPGYPYPDMADPLGIFTGYFLNDTSFEDVAILRITAFQPPGNAMQGWSEAVQKTVQDFLAASTEKGRHKLILDLQNNDGGSVTLSADLFAQLFPGFPTVAKNNRRAHLGWELISKAVGQDVLDLQTAKEGTNGSIMMNLDQLSLGFMDQAWPLAFDADGDHFKNWEAYYGPVQHHNGNTTRFFQADIADARQTLSSADDVGLIVSGTNNRTNMQASPFRPENVIVLSNGMCGSTCTTFAERLKNIAGVQFIVVGGRPQTGPMQAIGSVKGSVVATSTPGLDLSFPYLQVALANMSEQEYADRAQGTKWEAFAQSANATSRLSAGTFNTHNQFRVGDDTETPLHHVYEAADCRLWPTWEMLYDPVFTWNRVANIAFKERQGTSFENSQWCVAGSTGHPTSIGGGLEKGKLGPQTPPENAKFSTRGWELTSKVLDGRVQYRPDGPEAKEFRQECDGYDGEDWLFKAMCGGVDAGH